MNQETGGFRRRTASFHHLLGQPVRVRVHGDPRVHKLSSTVVDDEENEERPKPQGLHREQVASPDFVAMLGQELPPARRRRTAGARRHVCRFVTALTAMGAMFAGISHPRARVF